MLSKPYKYNDKLFRYNFDTGEVQYISKADKEMLEDNEEWQVKYGRNLWDIDAEGYIILGTVGLHPDNWKNKAARDEYLSGWCIDLDAETQSLARDFERYELPGLLKQMEGEKNG